RPSLRIPCRENSRSAQREEATFGDERCRVRPFRHLLRIGIFGEGRGVLLLPYHLATVEIEGGYDLLRPASAVDENLFAGDDRRPIAFPALHTPRALKFGGPDPGHASLRDHAVPSRSSPLRPVLGGSPLSKNQRTDEQNK